MSKFQETKKRLTLGENDKKIMNREAFNELTLAMLNEPDYERKTVKVVDGKPEEQVSYPIRELRKSMLEPMLKDAGLDTAEAAKVAQEYQFKKGNGLYEFVAEADLNYLETGRKLSLGKKQGLEASFQMIEKPTEIKEVSAPGKTEKTPTEYGAHRVIKSKSSCPDYLRKVVGR